MRKIILGDNALVLPTLPDKFARLIYIDPPFNTGKVQKRDRIRVTATDGDGVRGGFGGRRYDVQKVESGVYEDAFDDFETFLMPRIEAALRCLALYGAPFVHFDFPEIHYHKGTLYRMLRRDPFLH